MKLTGKFLGNVENLPGLPICVKYKMYELPPGKRSFYMLFFPPRQAYWYEKKG
jgi:hypothetical protein